MFLMYTYKRKRRWHISKRNLIYSTIHLHVVKNAECVFVFNHFYHVMKSIKTITVLYHRCYIYIYIYIYVSLTFYIIYK